MDSFCVMMDSFCLNMDSEPDAFTYPDILIACLFPSYHNPPSFPSFSLPFLVSVQEPGAL